MKSLRRFFYASLCIALLAAAGWAQDQPESPSPDKPSAGISSPDYPSSDSTSPDMPSTDSAQDPPGRVARLQYMNGQVSVQPHGVDEWVQGEANRPLTNSDNVWADKDSRAELNLGTGLMRIDSETSLTLTNVNNNAVQVSLHQGSLNVHVRHMYSDEVWEIDTPNLAFTVKKNGDYRFDVDPNADTTLVTVWKGDGEATGQGPSLSVHEGEQVQFSNGNSLTHDARNAPQRDSFDEWCQSRNNRFDNSASAKYVAPGVVGTEDLDEYGTWKETPDYGPVWVPTAVSPGWAPYSAGNWIWNDPWGWTWVDAYPWGFAPFHYGRWVSWGGYWGWAPGPYWARPWYAPALVGWFGGPRWGVGFGFGGGFGFGFGGGFGWCPLGFREPFYPWYHGSRNYFRNVNVSNTRITNINRITNNFYNHGTVAYGEHGGLPRYAGTAGRAMSRNNFISGRAVSGNSVRLTGSQLNGASALGRVNASPTRESMMGARATPASARPSQAAFSRPTVSRMTPPASSARSFASPARNSAASMPRNVASPAARGVGNSSPRPGNALASGSTAGRNVPRPPQSFNESATGRGAGNESMNRGESFNHNVPRPPSENGGMTAHNNVPAMGSYGSRGSYNSVPRPNGTVQSAPRTYPGSTGNYSNHTYGGYSSPSRGYNVPRPSGPVQSAPRAYSGSEGGYSTRAYGGYYGSSRGYSSPSYSGGGSPYRGYGGYGGYSGRGSYSAPSRSYSAPSHSFGGYSGGGGYHGSSGGGFHGGGGGGGGSHGGGGGGSHGGGHR